MLSHEHAGHSCMTRFQEFAFLEKVFLRVASPIPSILQHAGTEKKESEKLSHSSSRPPLIQWIINPFEAV